MLHICKLDPDPSKIELVTMQEISNKVSLDDSQKLEVKWSPEGDTLAIAGNDQLRVVHRSNMQEIETVSEISHENPISKLCWITENILVTVDILNNLKVWNYDSKSVVFKYSHKFDIVNVKYSSTLKCLTLFDSDGGLVVSAKDFVTEKSLMSAERKVSKLSLDKTVSKFDEKELEDLVKKPVSNETPDAEMQIENKSEEHSEEESKEEFKDKPKEEEQLVYEGNHYNDDSYQQPQNDFNMLIGAKPQAPLMSGAVIEPEDPNYRYLCWNSIGTVAIREEVGLNCVEVQFADETFHKNLLVEDDIKTEMATLGHNGVLLASKGAEIDLDQYEDDTDDYKYISQIKFIPFTSWNSIKPWSYDLPKGENADNLAIGSNFCAIATDLNYIRFFSLEGTQTFVTSYSCSIVTMIAYESLLCIITHNGLPMLESQNLRMKIIDVSKAFGKVVETEVPLSPSSNLIWTNFSEEGSIYTYDTEGVIRNFSFAMGNNWIPVLDVKQKYDIDADKFWIVGISEGEVTCCVLKNKSAPDQRDKSHLKSYKLCLPLLGLDYSGKLEARKNNLADNEEQYIREHLELTHQHWRRNQWSSLRNARSQKDPCDSISKSIYTDVETLEKKKQLDKITINTIRIAAMNSDKMRVLMYAKRLNLVKSYTLCMSMLHELKLPLIADELRKLRDSKEMEENNIREKQISSLHNSQKKEDEKPSYTSISQKILKTRADNEKAALKFNTQTPKATLKPSSTDEPKEKITINPFAKKENTNTINKKKDLFEDLLNKNLTKKPANVENTTTLKKKI